MTNLFKERLFSNGFSFSFAIKVFMLQSFSYKVEVQKKNHLQDRSGLFIPSLLCMHTAILRERIIPTKQVVTMILQGIFEESKETETSQ